MSLYILKLCAERWGKCDYYHNNRDYTKNFERYRYCRYSEVHGRKPNDYSEWTSICIGFTGSVGSAEQPKNPATKAKKRYIWYNKCKENSRNTHKNLALRSDQNTVKLNDNVAIDNILSTVYNVNQKYISKTMSWYC